jgi:2'-5' RNA ligase
MTTLREWIELIQENDHNQGTYAQLELSDSSAQQIVRWQQQLEVAAPTPQDDLHCTVVYSVQPCSSIDSIKSQWPITAKVAGLSVFPTQSGAHCLVLELDSPEIEKLHGLCRALGCSHSYSSYRPHVTLTYEWPSDQPPQDTDHIVGQTLKFVSWSVRGLNPKWSS